MKVTVRIPRYASGGSTSTPEAELATELQQPVSTFHAAFTDSAEDWVVRGTPQAVFTPRPEPTMATRPTSVPGALARAWAWLHTKYVQTATKRLRVAETVSLGEKRFVSILIVEGREFLIGGGASGVTLLAQLGTAQELRNTGTNSVRGDAA